MNPTPVATLSPAKPLVLIRSMGPAHRERVYRHLTALSPEDRYLRFGYAAGDAHIRRYVDGLNFGRDDVFGIVNRRLELLAMAHLAYLDGPAAPTAPALPTASSAPTAQTAPGTAEAADAAGAAAPLVSLAALTSPSVPRRAEFGVSVLAHVRGRGYGQRLFERAVVHARNQGVEQLLIHALTENKVMLSIAAQAGAHLVRDGSETEALLQLPPANFDTLLGEVLHEHMAQTDYRWKAQWQLMRRWWQRSLSVLGA